MKVLFISSGNSKSGISPIILNQGNSLKDQSIEVSFFTIKNKGIKGYINAIIELKKLFRNKKFDLVHAHYHLSAFATSLAGGSPLVVSLMGSDVKESFISRLLINLFSVFFWDKTIVKSNDMKKSLWRKEIEVLPNGVNINVFREFSRFQCRNDLGWSQEKTYILFGSNPNRYEKNYSLFIDSIEQIDNPNYETKCLSNIPHQDIAKYMNASNVIALSSLWEGSPNVIKEAMSCNVPIVSTKVGDVPELFENLEGCFLADSNINNYSVMIEKAMAYSLDFERTKARERIIANDLDSNTIAKKLITIYEQTLKYENNFRNK